MTFANQMAFLHAADDQYEIGLWHGFRNAALSFTFDDGSPGHYTKAVPLFNEFDMNLN